MSNLDPATGQRYDLDTWTRCARPLCRAWTPKAAFPSGGPARVCPVCEAAWQPAPGDWAYWHGRFDVMVIEAADAMVLVELKDLTRHVVPRAQLLLNELYTDTLYFGTSSLHAMDRDLYRMQAAREGLYCPPAYTLAEALAAHGMDAAPPPRRTKTGQMVMF